MGGLTVGLTVMKYQCNDCGEWFLKRERHPHEMTTDHLVGGAGVIFKSDIPEVEPIVVVLEQKAVEQPKLVSQVISKPSKMIDRESEIAKNAREEMPEMMKALDSLRLLMRHTGVIPMGDPE